MQQSILPQILLLGATGRTGRLVLEEALARGHWVTALVRRPSDHATLPEHHHLTIVTGNPCKEADVAAALRQAAASKVAAVPVPVVVVSTLGQTRRSGNPWAATTSPPRMMESAIKAVLSASSSSSSSLPSSLSSSSQTSSPPIQKLVVMSMFGAGDSFPNLNFLMRWIMAHSNMAQTIEDQNLVDAAVRGAGTVPFVLVRPAMLTNTTTSTTSEDPLPVTVYESSGAGAGFMPRVSARSVASFLLDVVVKADFDGMAPVIAN